MLNVISLIATVITAVIVGYLLNLILPFPYSLIANIIFGGLIGYGAATLTNFLDQSR